jgi:hypothetical protein
MEKIPHPNRTVELAIFAAVIVGGCTGLYQCFLKEPLADLRLAGASVANIDAGIQEELVSAIGVRPFSAERVAAAMDGKAGWDRLVVCEPYTCAREFTDAGVSSDKLAAALEWATKAPEEWHVIVLDSADRMVAEASTSLSAEEWPRPAVIVLRRQGVNTSSPADKRN